MLTATLSPTLRRAGWLRPLLRMVAGRRFTAGSKSRTAAWAELPAWRVGFSEHIDKLYVNDNNRTAR